MHINESKQHELTPLGWKLGWPPSPIMKASVGLLVMPLLVGLYACIRSGTNSCGSDNSTVVLVEVVW